MHPSSEPAAQTPAPPDPTQTQAAYLDDVMAQAEIAANAQRDIETEDAEQIPSASSERQEAPEPEPEPEDDEEDDEEDEEEESDDQQPAPAPEEAPDEPAPDDQPAPQPAPQQPRYSRRQAARFAAELDQTRQQLNQARGHLGYFQSSDQRIREHMLHQSGYVREQNGRTRYENLSEKLLRGTASVEEADEVAQMTSWHEFAGPIYRAAEEQVMGAFVSDWRALRDLEGIGEHGLQKLNSHTSPTAASRELHALALAAGEARATKRFESRIAKLEAENKSLRTGNLARSPQPASSNGAAVATNAGFLARAIDPKTGASTDEFDREVAAGKWLGADLAKH
jgi:hypothetical protein